MIRLCFIALVICALGACAAAPPATEAGADDEPTATVFVVVRGWHSDIALPAEALAPRLGGLRDTFPGASHFVIGLGERSFLLKEQPGLLDMVTALLPSPTALLVTAVRVPPPQAFPPPAEVIAVRVSPRGLAALSEFIASSFEYAPQGGPRLLARGPYPGSLFYYATRTYSAVFTCNTWTAEALQSTGLPVRASGVLFGGDVARQARQAMARQAMARQAMARQGVDQSIITLSTAGEPCDQTGDRGAPTVSAPAEGGPASCP